MKRIILMAGATALFSLPAFAESPTALHPAPTVLSQTQAPGSSAVVTSAPAGTTVIVAPTAPPPPQTESPPPPPSPTYVWDPGRWNWNGVQYVWRPGSYVEKPTVTATFVPGHWQQAPNGWVWADSHWDYTPGR